MYIITIPTFKTPAYQAETSAYEKIIFYDVKVYRQAFILATALNGTFKDKNPWSLDTFFVWNNIILNYIIKQILDVYKP